jgi:hypothetical protein
VTPTNFYPKAFTFKFKLRQSIFGNQIDQFAQLIHIDRRVEMFGLIAVAAASTIAITMPTIGISLRPRRYNLGLLVLLISHYRFGSG